MCIQKIIDKDKYEVYCSVSWCNMNSELEYNLVEEALPPKNTRRGVIDAKSMLHEFLSRNVKTARVDVETDKPTTLKSLLRSHIRRLKLPVVVHSRGKLIYLERRT